MNISELRLGLEQNLKNYRQAEIGLYLPFADFQTSRYGGHDVLGMKTIADWGDGLACDLTFLIALGNFEISDEVLNFADLNATGMAKSVSSYKKWRDERLGMLDKWRYARSTNFRERTDENRIGWIQDILAFECYANALVAMQVHAKEFEEVQKTLAERNIDNRVFRYFISRQDISNVAVTLLRDMRGAMKIEQRYEMIVPNSPAMV